MKNRFRWMCLCLLLLVGALLLCACGYSEPPEVNPIDVYFSTVGWYGHMPSSQVGSTWRSEDGRVEFTIMSTLIPEHTETGFNGVEYRVME